MCTRVRGLLLLAVVLLTGCTRTLGTPVFVSSLSPPATPPTALLTQPDAGDTSTPCQRPCPVPISPTVLLRLGPPPATPIPYAGSAVARAVADLAARLGVDPDAVKVVRVSAEEFPAQNLACPPLGGRELEPVQPAFVTGREMVLIAEGQRYMYHAHGGTVVFCGKLP